MKQLARLSMPCSLDMTTKSFWSGAFSRDDPVGESCFCHFGGCMESGHPSYDRRVIPMVDTDGYPQTG